MLRGKIEEKERNINWLTSARAPAQTRNPGLQPDREPNPKLFGVQDNAQPTEPL